MNAPSIQSSDVKNHDASSPTRRLHKMNRSNDLTIEQRLSMIEKRLDKLEQDRASSVTGLPQHPDLVDQIRAIRRMREILPKPPPEPWRYTIEPSQ